MFAKENVDKYDVNDNSVEPSILQYILYLSIKLIGIFGRYVRFEY